MATPAAFDLETASKSTPEGPLAGQINRRGVLRGAVAASAATLLAPLAGSTLAQAAAGALQINPSEETIRLGPLAVRFLVTGRTSTGSLAAFEMMVPGKQHLAAPAHSHDTYEETLYGIDGVLTWTVNGTRFEVGPGQALCIPRGAIHRFDNNGATDVKALCVITPAAIGPEFFRESAQVLNAAKGGPPDIAKMVAVMRRHGITPAPAP
jgi:quercetin dioxygenase-like cupin family protein